MRQLCLNIEPAHRLCMKQPPANLSPLCAHLQNTQRECGFMMSENSLGKGQKSLDSSRGLVEAFASKTSLPTAIGEGQEGGEEETPKTAQSKEEEKRNIKLLGAQCKLLHSHLDSMKVHFFVINQPHPVGTCSLHFNAQDSHVQLIFAYHSRSSPQRQGTIPRSLTNVAPLKQWI